MGRQRATRSAREDTSKSVFTVRYFCFSQHADNLFPTCKKITIQQLPYYVAALVVVVAAAAAVTYYHHL